MTNQKCRQAGNNNKRSVIHGQPPPYAKNKEIATAAGGGRNELGFRCFQDHCFQKIELRGHSAPMALNPTQSLMLALSHFTPF